MNNWLNTNPKTILFCMGCLSALAMAPVYCWPLMMAGYSILIALLTKTTNWKQAAFYGFLFFFGYFLTGLYWISSSLFVELNRWWWALPFSFVGLPLLLALIPATTIAIASFIPRYKAIAFIMALIIADFVRGHAFTGFPWNMPAHSWVNADLIMASLPVIGFYGLNSLSILVLSLPALLQHWGKALCFLAILGISFIPYNRVNTPELPADIHLIQANIPQKEKWNPQLIERNFNRYIEMSSQSVANKTEPQIIIWPETAISQNYFQTDHQLETFYDFLWSLPKGSILITGLLRFEGENAYNSIAVFDRNANILATYDKHHLVPFGEYMPFGLDTITGFKNFKAGVSPDLIRIKSLNFSFLPIVCYESIFPRYSLRATKGSIILQLTNDAWFGKTAGPYQHFDHARFRAAENNAPFIRLSVIGISGLIARNGHPVTTGRHDKNQEILLHSF